MCVIPAGRFIHEVQQQRGLTFLNKIFYILVILELAAPSRSERIGTARQSKRDIFTDIFDKNPPQNHACRGDPIIVVVELVFFCPTPSCQANALTTVLARSENGSGQRSDRLPVPGVSIYERVGVAGVCGFVYLKYVDPDLDQIWR
eukprot:sb/3473854/